ncbi:DUF1272 domain-containing protein [bacterium]|nr:DUF1272 domain-containing protein [bacterium]
MRPNCECCGRDLSPEGGDALICSFECTFCVTCTEDVLKGTCPNCGGDLSRRPRRVGAALKRNPASARRVVRAAGCAARDP